MTMFDPSLVQGDNPVGHPLRYIPLTPIKKPKTTPLLAGETAVMSLQLDSDEPYAFSDSPVLTVELPDGSVITPAVVDSSSDVAVSSHILSAIVPLNMAGPYDFTWTYNVGAARGLKSTERYFVTWIDVLQGIRERLRTDETNLSYNLFIAQFDLVSRTILRQFSGLGFYWNLSEDDQENFDMGVSLLVGARLRPIIPRTIPLGNMTSLTVGPLRFGYTHSKVIQRQVPLQPGTEEDLLIEDAWDILLNIPIVANIWNARQQAMRTLIAIRGTISSSDDFGR